MGLLDRGNRFLTKSLAKAGGVTIVYTRPGTAFTATITDAVVGQPVANVTQPGEASSRVETQERDYLIPSASLPFGPPVKGDRITESGVGIFEAAKRQGEAEWRWSDAERTVYRVHVKQVG